MANLCSLSMRVIGKQEDVERFIKIARQEDAEYYMGRGADLEISDRETISENKYCVVANGWCKWSVYSAMYDNAIDMRTHPDRWCGDLCGSPITINEASEILNVEVEVYSEEPGCCFMEHYVIISGDWIVEECVEYNEYCTLDFDTVEEMNKEFGTHFTKEEFEENDYLHTGGMDWDFGEY